MKKIYFLILSIVLFGTGGCSNSEEPLGFEEQLQQDVETIDAYLAANNVTALQDPSGLRYVIISQGTGTKPTLSNSIKVKYKGTFLSNGQIFDQANSAVVFKLSSLITAWKIGFQLLPAGSKAILYVPSGLAYGTRATGPIPPNSNLIFEVELFEVL